MSIDYDASWSSNIKLTDEMVDYAITNGYLNADFWDDPRDYFEYSDIPFGIVTYGSYFTGNLEYYLDFNYRSVSAIHNHLDIFVQDLKTYFDIDVDEENIEITCGVIIS